MSEADFAKLHPEVDQRALPTASLSGAAFLLRLNEEGWTPPKTVNFLNDTREGTVEQ